MKLVFEHDYQQKILRMQFAEPCLLTQEQDIMQWRSLWMEALKTWHSPYKALIDARQLKLGLEVRPEELKAALARMDKVLKGFFLKSAIIFGLDEDLASLMPFEVAASEEEAYQLIGVRHQVQKQATDFRSMIQLQNHFRQHVVELSFTQPVTLEGKEHLQILRSKLTNNLMQWHSAWSLLVDCSQLECQESMAQDWALLEKYLKGFFMKQVVGYSPKQRDGFYPFKVYRARHNAAGSLEAEGLFSGEDANCKSRKS